MSKPLLLNDFTEDMSQTKNQKYSLYWVFPKMLSGLVSNVVEHALVVVGQ